MPKIDDHDFGRIVVDGLEQTRDVILLPGRVVLNWWRQDGHRCSTTSRLRANNDREMVRKQVLPKPAPSLTTHVRHRPLPGRGPLQPVGATPSECEIPALAGSSWSQRAVADDAMFFCLFAGLF
jgi:hypothetical protein